MNLSELKPQRTQRTTQRHTEFFSDASSNTSASSAVKSNGASRLLVMAMLLVCTIAFVSAQTRRRPRPAQRQTQTQAPRGSAAKYSAFLHSSDKHKGLACNACRKVPTEWNAKRDFPDVADFPDHDACVRCHRQQFVTRQAMVGTGPTICTVCHVRAAPREEARFAFGAPNIARLPLKAKPEWQFTIEFPHDKHQNAIASLRALIDAIPTGAQPSRLQQPEQARTLALQSDPSIRFVSARFSPAPDDKKPDYNNCSICPQPNRTLTISPLPTATPDPGLAYPFKSMPHSHDACFNCHWREQKPVRDDCAGCHKLAAVPLLPVISPQRISMKFAHEGGKGEHVMECTTCHINITRAATLRGLTPDVPIAACANCHKDDKKITYPKAVTIEEEFAQYKKTGECTYCHTPDVGKKKPPPSHDAVAQ